MSALDFPTQDDINRIYGTTPLQPIRDMNERIFTLLKKDDSTSSFETFPFKSIEVSELLWQLHYRLMDVAKSYVLLSYFFEKGIPDDEWYISPGKQGESIEYFPHFQPIHHQVKEWFDYFSDTFYSKFFSALDVVGHLINLQYDLGMKKVYFGSAVSKLGTKNQPLFQELSQELTKIMDDPIFKEAHRLRKDITHNYLPGSTGFSVTREPRVTDLGIREYTPSAAMMSNIQKSVDLLERIVTLVTE